MADVITRFKLETTQFDSKLRDTAKALQGISHQASLGGKDFNKFSEEAIKSAQALGTVQSGATNTKDKLKDLVGSYNDAAKAYNNLTETAKQGEFGKAMSKSLTQLQQRIRETKQELYSIGDAVKGGGGGKFTDMLSVAGGNLIAQGAMKLADDLKATVQQGIELARAGEGIRVAFDKLNQPGLLANLREATHGTVTDLELMKAAVKFNDFKLPLEELGTMLAFAQKKAKDTGQSVDYMVDSIVTGLGRKSVMILDNLGLSAAQIKERMKEGGDMTKAVGDIIREEMQKAGDYVETAADRANRAAAEAKNQMEELGRAAMPVAEEFDKAWNTIKIGGMQLMNTVLTPLANSLKYIQSVLGSNPKQLFEDAWEKAGGAEGDGPNVDDNGNFIKRPADGNWAGFDAVNGTWKKGVTPRALYNRATGQTELPEISVQGHIPTKTTVSGGGGGGNRQQINLSPFVTSEGEKFELGRNFQSLFGNEEFINIQRKLMGMDGEMTRDWGKEIGKVFADYIDDPDKLKRGNISEEITNTEILQGTQTMISSLQSIVGGINQLGIDIPQELNDIFGVLQTITGIVGSIQAMQQVGTWLGLFSHGGVVHAANGYVSGTTYSGDQIPAMLNSGELVLNKAQQGVLASSLQAIGQGGDGGGARPYVNGEMIWLGLTNYLNRSGRGEIVTSRRK